LAHPAYPNRIPWRAAIWLRAAGSDASAELGEELLKARRRGEDEHGGAVAAHVPIVADPARQEHERARSGDEARRARC